MSPNPVVHFEIGCTDASQTAEFFTELFAWNIGDAAGGFAVDTGGEADLPGHLVELAPEWGNYLTMYVQVDDLEETMEKAVSLGGKTLVGPIELPGQGSFAWIAPPEGHIIGIWKPLPSSA